MSKIQVSPSKGIAFINSKKTSESHPNFTGLIRTPEGHLYHIGVWVNQGKSGQFLSMELNEPMDKDDYNRNFSENDFKFIP